MMAVGLARPPRPSASVVIVAFHRPEPLARLLEALGHAELEVVVVNVEDDPAVARVAEGAVLVPTAQNVGYAAAVNAGSRVAAAPVVVFANDDVELRAPDVLRLAAAVASGETDVAVPRVVDGVGRIVRTIAVVPTPRSLAREWMVLPDTPIRRLAPHLEVEKWRAPMQPEVVEAASAAVVAVRADLLAEVPIPEGYFLYWEESEWFFELRRRGARVEYRPEAAVRHLGGRDDVRPEKSRLLARNAVRCVRRTQGRWAAVRAYPVVVGWNARLLLVDAVRVARRPDPAGRVRLRARAAGLRAAVSSLGEAW